MDNANLFVHVNMYGAMALLPAVLLMEVPTTAAHPLSHLTPHTLHFAPCTLHLILTPGLHTPHRTTYTVHLTSYTSYLTSYTLQGPALYEQLVDGGPARRLLILNGIVYWLNNQMNFLVLEKVDAVTHGLINCGRRVANIAFAIVWFRVPVTIFNGIGMALALFGTFSYMRAKQAITANAAKKRN